MQQKEPGHFWPGSFCVYTPWNISKTSIHTRLQPRGKIREHVGMGLFKQQFFALRIHKQQPPAHALGPEAVFASSPPGYSGDSTYNFFLMSQIYCQKDNLTALQLYRTVKFKSESLAAYVNNPATHSQLGNIVDTVGLNRQGKPQGFAIFRIMPINTNPNTSGVHF